jgi:hypothetical protein
MGSSAPLRAARMENAVAGACAIPYAQAGRLRPANACGIGVSAGAGRTDPLTAGDRRALAERILSAAC